MENAKIVNKLTKPWIALMLIAFVAVVIYSNIYGTPFIFDDIRQVEDKSTIRDLKIFLSPRAILSLSPRPVVDLTFALNYKFGKLNAFGYHLVNVTIHIINGFLAYFLSLIIFKRLTYFSPITQSPNSAIPLMSLFTALIFVAHPIQTQAVTYTVQRYTSMAAMFYFLSILCYLQGRIFQHAAGKRGQKAEKVLTSRILSAFSFQLIALYAVCLLFGIAAFLCKESAANLLGAILLAEYMLFDRTWKGWKKKLLWFAPVVAFMVVFILYVYGLFRGEVQFGRLFEGISAMLRAPATTTSRWIYLCTQFNVIPIYIGLLFLPVGQNLDYMYPLKTGFFDGYTPLAFLFLLLIVGVGVWNIRKRPIITFGIFWFFITLSVESSIFPIKDTLFEHRLYLPMFGFALVISYVIFCLLPIKRLGHVVVSILIVVSLGMATYLRNMVYKDGITLWSDVVTKSPKNVRAHYNLGTALQAHGRLEEAIMRYSKALSIRPGYVRAHDNLGVVLTEVGRVDDAIKNFSDALKIRPNDPLLHCNLGLALMRKGNLQEAAGHFSEALRIKPDHPEAHSNLGITLAQQGKLKDAILHFKEAVRIEPDNVKIHGNLGQAFMLQGNLPEAAQHYSEAVRIKPDYAEAHSKLGVVLVRQGDLDGGIEHFMKALQIKPGLAEARQGLNKALGFKGSKNPPYR